MSNFNRKKTPAGFTILEFLIYIAILTVAVAGMGLVVSNIFRVGVKTDIIQEVSYNGRFVMERIKQTVNEASDIIEPETEEKQLNLSFEDGNPVIFKVVEKAGRKKLVIQETDQAPIDLTTDRVTVDRLIFKKIGEDSVRVEIIVSYYNPQNIPDYEFKSFFTSSFSLKN